MTIEQYKDKAADKIMSDMFSELCKHDETFSPQSVTEQYWLMELRLAITPWNNRGTGLSIKLVGNGLEIKSQWPYSIFFRNGAIVLGAMCLQTDCFEQSVEDLRFLESILPNYNTEYKAMMDKAEIEQRKQEMIGQVCCQTICPVLQEIAKETDGKVAVSFGAARITISLRNRNGRRRRIYIDYNNPIGQLESLKGRVKEFMNSNTTF